MRTRLLICATLTILMGQMAFADVPQLNLKVGANPVTNVVGSGNSVSFTSTNFFGWTLNIVFGASNSPGLVPYGIDLTSLSAACGIASCGQLTIQLSDTGFTQPSPSFKTFYSSSDTGSTASTTQTAYDDPNNVIFGTTNLIGTVGPLLGPGGSGTAQGGGPEVGGVAHPYSLTINDVFAGCSSGVGCVSYSSDGNITGVPEPGAVVLFGSVLAICASRLRRRKSA